MMRWTSSAAWRPTRWPEGWCTTRWSANTVSANTNVEQLVQRLVTQADVNNSPQCISQLVTAIRNDVGEPSLPLLLNDYEMGTTGPLAPTTAFALAIRSKILEVPTVVSTSEPAALTRPTSSRPTRPS